MNYKVFTSNGYITSIQHNATDGNLTEAEYQKIIELLNNKPEAPEGHIYCLKENLEWDLYKLPESSDIEE